MKDDSLTVLVVGAGTMGGGIAQVAAAAGDRVLIYDAQPGAAEQARERSAASLERAQAKGYVTNEDIERTLGNMHPVTALEEGAAADVVVEAVKEDLDIKRQVFAALEEVVSETCGLWTNTSMILISRIMEKLRHPERAAGTHFFNPVPRMKLVEVIAGERTSEEAVQFAMKTVGRWGKTAVRAPDSPGFIVNRILDVIKREALSLLDEGVPPDQVDTAVRLGLNFPMGPFELMDLVGLNTTLDCLIAQAKGMNRPAEFGPHLPKLVEEKNWGRKTGQGFYSYNG